MLATARIGVGIGEASASPAAYSMISDYFPKEKRATALSIYSSRPLYRRRRSACRSAAWSSAAGTPPCPIPPTAPLGLAGWQAAFLAVGIPGLLLALWVLTLREPQRGASDGLPQPVVRPNAWRDFGRELLAILPPLTLFSVARIPGALRINLLVLGRSSCAVGYGLLPADRRRAAMGRLRPRRLCGLLLGAVAQAPRSAGLPADLGQSPVVDARHRLRQHLVHDLCDQLLGAALCRSAPSTAPATAPRAFHRRAQPPRRRSRLILGWGAAIAAATGVILGGIISDLWRRRDPRGRIFVNMLAVVLPDPGRLASCSPPTASPPSIWASPFAQLFGSAWVGAAVATLQDVVLPRMRATAGATYVLGTTMVGLALGPYFAGKMADVTGSLSAGICCALLRAALHPDRACGSARASIAELEATKVERARAAGEPI